MISPIGRHLSSSQQSNTAGGRASSDSQIIDEIKASSSNIKIHDNPNLIIEAKKNSFFVDVYRNSDLENSFRQLKTEIGSTYAPKIILSALLLRSYGPYLMLWMAQAFPVLSQSGVLPAIEDIKKSITKDSTKINWLGVKDEGLLDTPEGFFNYFGPIITAVLAAVGMAKATTKLLLKNNPHTKEIDYRLIGTSYSALEEAIAKNKPILLGVKYGNQQIKQADGTLKDTDNVIIKSIYDYKKIEAKDIEPMMPYIARSKALIVMISLLYTMGIEHILPNIRNMLSVWLLNEGNPYILLGLPYERTEDDIKKQNAHVLKNSIRNALEAMGVMIGAGLFSFAAIRIGAGTKKPLFPDGKSTWIARNFDLGSGFGLASWGVAAGLTSALFGYANSSRSLYNEDKTDNKGKGGKEKDNSLNDPEFYDFIKRIGFVVVMGVWGREILKKALINPLVGNKYKYTDADGSQKSVDLTIPWSQMREENGFAAKLPWVGKVPLFDSSGVYVNDISNIKDNDRDISRVKGYDKLTEEQKTGLRKSVTRFNNWGIFGIIFGISTLINVYNYMVNFNKSFIIQNKKQDETKQAA